jgi:hypothetical protein
MRNTPVSDTVVPIYTPAPAGIPHVTIQNIGGVPLYIGGSAVTVSSGLRLNPNDNISLDFATYAIYAVGGTPGTGGSSTTLSATVSSGGTTLSVTSSNGFTPSTVIAIGAVPAQETTTVSGTAGGTSITIGSNLLYDHASGAAVTVLAGASPYTGSVAVAASAS